jgi:hypothetical protein
MSDYPDEPKTVDAGPPQKQRKDPTAPRRPGPTPQELDRREREKRGPRKPMGPTEEGEEDRAEESAPPPTVPPTSPAPPP